MESLKKLLPWLLVAVAFLLGQLSNVQTTRDQVKRFQEERKLFLNTIQYQNVRINSLHKVRGEIRERMILDSLAHVNAIQVKESRIRALQNKVNEISRITNNASAAELDSLRHALYSTR